MQKWKVCKKLMAVILTLCMVLPLISNQYLVVRAEETGTGTTDTKSISYTEVPTLQIGEKPLPDLVKNMKSLLTAEEPVLTSNKFRTIIGSVPQTAYLCRATEWTSAEDDLPLYSHEECLADKKKQASNFRHIEEESNKYSASRITQAVGNKIVVVNPPYPPMSQEDLDRSFDLPYTRLPHPKYKGKRLPA